MELPASVQKILLRLRAHGEEAFAVGGCVRDFLLGRTPADWDVTTSARPEAILSIFADRRVLPTGIRHGTVTVWAEDDPIEVTTYRVDGDYSDHRHPDAVRFTHSLTDDLARRDFTVNAMACGLNGAIIDPFGGRADLAQRVIRCVGDPIRRFDEDALRILRALRFASTLCFAIDAQTASAIHRSAPLLHAIAAERIQTELQKLICGAAAACVLAEYGDVWVAAVPQLAPVVGNSAEWAARSAQLAQSAPDFSGRMAILLRGQDAAAAMHALRCDRKAIAQTAALAALPPYLPPKPDDVWVRTQLAALGLENWARALGMQPAPVRAAWQARTALILARGDCWRINQLAVNAAQLMAAGCPAGPAVGQTLRALRDAVIRGTLPNEPGALLQAAAQQWE